MDGHSWFCRLGAWMGILGLAAGLVIATFTYSVIPILMVLGAMVMIHIAHKGE